MQWQASQIVRNQGSGFVELQQEFDNGGIRPGAATGAVQGQASVGRFGSSRRVAIRKQYSFDCMEGGLGHAGFVQW